MLACHSIFVGRIFGGEGRDSYRWAITQCRTDVWHLERAATWRAVVVVMVVGSGGTSGHQSTRVAASRLSRDTLSAPPL